MTVGYGDILPISGYEKIFTVLILVIGVAMFSYTLSTLANQFSNLTISNSRLKSRRSLIDELDIKYKLPFNLIQKIEHYFSYSDSVISISQDFEINTILDHLPPNLKTRLSLFLYRDAI